MAAMFGNSYSVTFTTPITALGTWQVIPSTQLANAILEFGRLVGSIDVAANTSGGQLDLALQTSYNKGVAGSWKDVARINSIANSAAAISWGFVLTRGGSGSATAPLTINPTDVPTILVNVMSGQSLGDSIRVQVMPGAATTVGVSVTFAFVASP